MSPGLSGFTWGKTCTNIFVLRLSFSILSVHLCPTAIITNDKNDRNLIRITSSFDTNQSIISGTESCFCCMLVSMQPQLDSPPPILEASHQRNRHRCPRTWLGLRNDSITLENWASFWITNKPYVPCPILRLTILTPFKVSPFYT